MRRTVLTAAAVAFALAGVAVPASAPAGTLSYDAATQVLTFTGSDGPNVVFADHLGGDTGNLRIVDVGGEETTATEAPQCQPDDLAFHLVCPTPAKLIVNLGGGEDSFSDESVSGDPIAVPMEVSGGADGDEFDGGGAADTLRGGPGNDKIRGDGGIDTIVGEDGDDTITGGAGNDDLTGGPGADLLTGGLDNDVVRGGDGDDDLDYSPEYAVDGKDVYEGGLGSDSFGYFGRTISVVITLDGEANDGQAGENDNIDDDIEAVDGSDVADFLTGSPGADGLAGRGGDDTISGLGGNDLIYGDSGNDTIDGEDGDDALDGGCHNDTITGGLGVDSLNSDGTCESPDLRGTDDVLRARDGVRDSLVLCTISGAPGDTAIVDANDPALPASEPGGCRTIDAGTAPTPGTTTPGTAPGGATPGGTTSLVTLAGTTRATLGATVRLLTGSGRPGQAARQLLNLKAKPARLTLGSLVATAAARVSARATVRIRRRRVTLGSATVTVVPGKPLTLGIRLSAKGKSALRRARAATVSVRFVVTDPLTDKRLHQSTKTFRITVRR